LSNLLAQQQAPAPKPYYVKQMHYTWDVSPKSWSEALLGFDLGF
jgi:hypothetical protein